MPLFGGNQDFLHIFLDGNQGAYLQKIIPAVSHQIFNGLSGFGEQLDFVKYEDALPREQPDAILNGQQHIEGIKIPQIQPKIILDLLGHSGKINQDIAFVLVFREFFHNGGFADSARSLHQQSLLAVGLLFPGEEFIVYRPFKKHWHHLQAYDTIGFDNTQVKRCRIF